MFYKYRIEIFWHSAPSSVEQTILATAFGNLDGNNRAFLLDKANEIMRTLRNVREARIEDIAPLTVLEPDYE